MQGDNLVKETNNSRRHHNYFAEICKFCNATEEYCRECPGRTIDFMKLYQENGAQIRLYNPIKR